MTMRVFSNNTLFFQKASWIGLCALSLLFPFEFAFSQSKQGTSRPSSAQTSQKGSHLAKARPTSNPTTQNILKKRNIRSQAKSQKGCETGCAAAKDTAPTWTPARFSMWMKKYANEPLRAGSRALETLLFHGKTTRMFLKKWGAPPISQTHLNFLQRELKRDQFELSFRIVDEKGRVRIGFKKKIRVGSHFHVEAHKSLQIQRPSFGGKSKRVGLHHIWIRI